MTLLIFGFAALAAFVCFLGIIRPVPILIYHFIDGEGKKKGLSVSIAAFERQMRYLLANGYRVISLEELAAYRRSGQNGPQNAVVITFDDGDEAFFTKVYPFLLKYHLPATMFVITDWIGRQGYLSWHQIKAMHPDIVTFGSHTVTHRYLPSLSADEIRNEIVASKEILERELRRRINLFSYPVGGFTPEIARQVEAAGYAAACTTNRGRNFFHKNLFALKRVKMTERSVGAVVLAAKFSGYYDVFKELFPKKPGEPLAEPAAVKYE